MYNNSDTWTACLGEPPHLVSSGGQSNWELSVGTTAVGEPVLEGRIEIDSDSS